MKNIKFNDARPLDNKDAPSHTLGSNSIKTPRGKELPLSMNKTLTQKTSLQKNNCEAISISYK